MAPLSACALAFVAAQSAAAPASRGVERINGRRVAAGEALVRYRRLGVHSAPSTDPDIDTDERLGAGKWHLVRSRRRSADALVRALAARADIDVVEPNYTVGLSGEPNDLAGSLWGLQNTGQLLDNGDRGSAGADIGAVRAWDVSTGSRDNVVAVIDTGIMATHEDLAPNLWSAPDSFSVTIAGRTITCPAGTHGFNAVAMTCDPADDNGHGSHVAGSIGAAGNNALGVVGVNWTTSMMAVKFLDGSGSGFVSDAVNAIEFVVQAKQAFAESNGANVRVLNNSWDGGDYSQALADEIQRAADADMLFVAAAGNHSSDNGARPVYPANYGVSNVLSVAATDYRDQLASFSDYSATAVHLAAPGTLIYSTAFLPGNPTTSSYQTMSGTSMATAYVSGAAALVLSHCAYTTDALRDALLRTSSSLPSLIGKVESGRRLDAAAAVASCDSTPASPSDIVIYAADVPAANLHGAWTLEADASAADGSTLATADAGVSNTSGPLPSPTDYVDVAFSAPAGVPYHLWLRLRATDDSRYNDSVYVQFSDALLDGSPAYELNSSSALTVNLENCSGCGVAGWGWQDGAYWQTPGAVVTFASSGSHTMRIQVREDGVALDQIVLSPSTYLSSSPGQVTNDAVIVPKSGSSSTTLTPYGGIAAAIPGTIEIANFDDGGEGVAYHDTTSGNSGGSYRATDVDVEPSADGGYDVGWIAAGEWLNYTVDVAAAGDYVVSLRVAAPSDGGAFHIGFNNASGVWVGIAVPATGGWQTWTTVSAPVTLGAGRQQLTIFCDSPGYNLGTIIVAQQ